VLPVVGRNQRYGEGAREKSAYISGLQLAVAQVVADAAMEQLRLLLDYRKPSANMLSRARRGKTKSGWAAEYTTADSQGLMKELQGREKTGTPPKVIRQLIQPNVNTLHGHLDRPVSKHEQGEHLG
jgi:hypothetical protein